MANEKLVFECIAAHARGWKLIRLRGKIPLDKGWQETDTPIESILAHAKAGGNVGVRTGKASGVVVVDLDTAKGCTLTPADFPKTWTVKTGGGGYHLFFRCPADGLANSAGKLAPHADIRGNAGQVVLVGSIHPDTKKPYTWADGLSPNDGEKND